VKVDGLPRDVQQGMPVADGYFVLDIDSTPERDVTDGQFFVAFGLFLVLLGYAWSAVARRYEKWSATR
jgi:hypothetical protein